MLVSVILGLVLFSNADADCIINPFIGAGLPKPLLVRSTNFVYPTSARSSNISFSTGQTVDFACPGGRLVLGGTTTVLDVATATCVGGTNFIINNNSPKRYSWCEVRCSADPTWTARFTNGTCVSKGREVEVGYKISNTRFVRNMLICFDAALQSPINTYFELIPAITQQITGTPRPNWTQGSGIFTITNVNNLYTQATQRVTINSLLGLPAASTQYIQNNKFNFLSRGHLAARSDFFYASQQLSTFHFVNSLPQWQSFNGFNWVQAENDVQNYARKNNVLLKVWTGGYGVTTLPHARTRAQIKLYLHVHGNQKRMPVPEIFWKVVYNPTNQRGVVLIGVNNPYKDRAQINQFCLDQSSSLKWLNWQKNNQSRGFSWACTVPDFRRFVKDFPDFRISGLLF